MARNWSELSGTVKINPYYGWARLMQVIGVSINALPRARGSSEVDIPD